MTVLGKFSVKGLNKKTKGKKRKEKKRERERKKKKKKKKKREENFYHYLNDLKINAVFLLRRSSDKGASSSDTMP